MDIKTTCLGVLAKRSATGYEIRKAFEEGPFSHFAEGGFGSIYPALNKLDADGLVTCERAEQDRRPDKKIYHITERGRRALTEALEEKVPGEDKYKSDLLFLLFFAEDLTPDHISIVIDSRIAWYEAKIAQIQEREKPAQPDGADLVGEFGIAVYRSALEFLVSHRQAFIDLAAADQPAATAAE